MISIKSMIKDPPFFEYGTVAGLLVMTKNMMTYFPDQGSAGFHTGYYGSLMWVFADQCG